MDELTSFQQLMARVRAGDDQAWQELIRTYEPHIRRVIRVRLTDAKVRRLIDSQDICQSVFTNFWVRAEMGQFDLSTPEQFAALLAAMARNQVLRRVQWHHAQQRDVARTADVRADSANLAGVDGTPSENVTRRELLDRFHALLSSQERFLVEQRSAGRSWQDLAQELGSTADTLRMRFSRALDRAAEQLGLGSSTDG